MILKVFKQKYEYVSKLADKDDPKAPFSIVTTSRCKEDATFFSGLLHLHFIGNLIILNVQQEDIKYHLLNGFCMTRPGIELQSTGQLANTQTIKYIYILMQF